MSETKGRHVLSSYNIPIKTEGIFVMKLLTVRTGTPVCSFCICSTIFSICKGETVISRFVGLSCNSLKYVYVYAALCVTHTSIISKASPQGHIMLDKKAVKLLGEVFCDYTLCSGIDFSSVILANDRDARVKGA